MAIDSSAGSKAARFPVSRMGAALLVGFGSWGGQALAQDTPRVAIELPAVQVTGTQYDPDDVRPEGVTTATKTYMAPKDIPQTIDTLEVNKSKSYGINDLATMLDGVPGVNTS